MRVYCIGVMPTLSYLILRAIPYNNFVFQMRAVRVIGLIRTTLVVTDRAEKPQQMIRTGAVAAWCWRDFEEIPHIQGQRTRPSYTIGGAKSRLKSNPIPARDVQRAQTNLVHSRTQRPHRD